MKKLWFYRNFGMKMIENVYLVDTPHGTFPKLRLSVTRLILTLLVKDHSLKSELKNLNLISYLTNEVCFEVENHVRGTISLS